MASLESLNDDCLREILQYCDTNDHISFVIAFEQCKPIVQDIWKMFWRELRVLSSSDAIKISVPHNGDWREINSQSLKIVVDLIQPFVEEIYINGKNKEMLDIINASQFPKATELRLYDISASPIVKSCFPNLRSLVLGGDSVVAYNPEWNGLEYVDVCYSDMRISELMEFISQLKLKKFTFDSFVGPIPYRYRNYEYFSELEELSGKISTMKIFSYALKVMQKLRKFSVTYDCADLDADISIFSKILGTRAIEFFMKCMSPAPASDMKYLINQLRKLPNLNRLTLECNDIQAINIVSRSCKMHLLKTVILSDMRVDAEILTNILISVRQLELLELRHCIMDGTRLMHLDVARILQSRWAPITINLDHLNRNKFEILLSAPTDLIKITKNPIVQQYYIFQYILEQQ